jgi:hypothetical protein
MGNILSKFIECCCCCCAPCIKSQCNILDDDGEYEYLVKANIDDRVCYDSIYNN